MLELSLPFYYLFLSCVSHLSVSFSLSSYRKDPNFRMQFLFAFSVFECISLNNLFSDCSGRCDSPQSTLISILPLEGPYFH